MGALAWIARAAWHSLRGHPPDALQRWEHVPPYGWCHSCKNVVKFKS